MLQREPDVVVTEQAVPARARDAGALCDLHGTALFGLALMILGDREDAAAVTRHAILDACSGPVTLTYEADRCELTRYAYVRCVRELSSRSHLGEVPTRGPMETEVTSPAWAALSVSERAALALGHFGERTCQEIAGLMNLPRSEVAALLRSGLHALRQGPGLGDEDRKETQF